MTDIIGLVLIAAGLAFDVLGCLGLVRLPDVYNRLQASTKCVTLGTCSILIGTIFITGLNSTGFKALLAVFFLVLTSPVSAHVISRGAHKAGIRLWKGSECDALSEDKKEAAQ
jgi:multicomponent Na+:H+ antiporter subunit G